MFLLKSCNFLLILTTIKAIYVPNDDPKPATSSTGIKTWNTNQITLHHNYSKVSQQTPSGYHPLTHDPSPPLQIHPIYNGHSYGSEVHIINGTNRGTNIGTTNSTPQIYLHKTRRHSPHLEIYKTCPEGTTGQFIYELSCNQFLNCWKGRGFVQNCSPGTLFNPKTLECDFMDKVECVTGPRQSREGRRAQDVRQVGCPAGFSGIIPDYSDCAQFLNCANGKENKMACPPGTLFDVTRNVCDFANKAKCFNGQNEKIVALDTKLDFGGKSTTSGGSTTLECEFGTSGLFKHPTDCSKFMQCSNGATFIQECAPGTLFNPKLSVCDFPYNVPCSTTSTTDGTDDENTNLHYHHGGHQIDQDVNSGTGYHHQSHRQETNPGGTKYYQTHYGHGLHDPLKNQGQESMASGGYYQTHYDTHHHTDVQGVGQIDDNQGTTFGYPPNGQQGNYLGQGSTSSNGRNNYDAQNTYNQNQGTNSQNQGYGDNGQGLGGAGYHSSGQGTTGVNGQIPFESNGGFNQNQGSGYHRQEHASFGGTSGQGTSGVYVETRPSGVNDNPNQDHGYHQQEQPGSGYQSNGGRGTTEIYGQEPDDTRPTGVSFQQNQGNGYHRQEPTRYHSNGQGSTGIYRQEPEDTRPTGVNYNNQGNGYHRQESAGSRYRPQSTNGIYGQQPIETRPSYNQNGYLAPSNNGQSTTGIYGQQPIESGYKQNQGQDTQYHSGTHGVYNQNPTNYNQNHGTGYHRQTPDSGYHTGTIGYDQRPNNQNQGYHPIQPDQNVSPTNQRHPQGHNYKNQQPSGSTQPNYDQVINVNDHLTTEVPHRRPYEPFFGSTTQSSNLGHGTTHQSSRQNQWPPPFPSTDLNADYIFEYDDGEITIASQNSGEPHDGTCNRNSFHCGGTKCIPRTAVCDGHRHCDGGTDETDCAKNTNKFTITKDHKLAVLEKERWDNVTVSTCAWLCLHAKYFPCKSFNYRKIDKTCFLTNTNNGLTGALIAYYPCDFYELTSDQIDCTGKYRCPNSKCIDKYRRCDGQDDCGDRSDEKGCTKKDFGYRLQLVGTTKSNEGHIEVTAFGKTGFICDDKFGLRDAHVVCKELGYHLGATEVKGNSFYGSTNTTNYMMDDVSCLGNETSLIDCDFNGWGVHNCLPQEVVGVVCKTPEEKCPKDFWQCDTSQECIPLTFLCDGLLDCTDESDEKYQHCEASTELRLANGTTAQEGRVEIKHHGTWGTICDDDFNEDAAKVVCRSLGFQGSAWVKKDGYYGPGKGPIWLDQVFCSGNESTIDGCTHWDWGEHNCDHGEDVGVLCSNYEAHEKHAVVEKSRSRSYGELHPQGCGLRKDGIFGFDDGVHFRVVKGSKAAKGFYPWQAAIRVKGKTKDAHWCGAVVISSRFLLTAAHCLVGSAKGSYIITAGDYNIDDNEGTEQSAFIDDFFVHEEFRKGHKMANDIALVRLKGRGFTLNGDVQAICLPDADAEYGAEKNCTISGFGSIESGKSRFSHDLRAGWVPIQSREVCSMPHVYGEALTEGMVCAGSLDEGVDSCDGDSGGPLACLNNGVFTLFGITSWGQHCGYANKPGVYVKVSHYKKWIDDTLQKNADDNE